MSIPDFVAYDALLDNMDKRCRTSINGLRVTDAIAALLPSKDKKYEANIEVFRIVIRFLKHWAKRRCVYAPFCTVLHCRAPHLLFSPSRRYGNKEGLLMGVALEIMLVLVCQLFPNQSDLDILHNFFKLFAKWPWDHEDKGVVIIKGDVHEMHLVLEDFYIVTLEQSCTKLSVVMTPMSVGDLGRRKIQYVGSKP